MGRGPRNWEASLAFQNLLTNVFVFVNECGSVGGGLCLSMYVLFSVCVV